MIRGCTRYRSRLRLIVLYDDTCPICRFAAVRWRRLDWFQLLEFHSLWTFDLQGLSVTREELITRMHAVRQRDSHVFSGFDAVLHVIMRLPLLAVLTPALWLLLRLGIGERAYAILAARRYTISGGSCPTSEWRWPRITRRHRKDQKDQRS